MIICSKRFRKAYGSALITQNEIVCSCCNGHAMFLLIALTPVGLLQICNFFVCEILNLCYD